MCVCVCRHAACVCVQNAYRILPPRLPRCGQEGPGSRRARVSGLPGLGSGARLQPTLPPAPVPSPRWPVGVQPGARLRVRGSRAAAALPAGAWDPDPSEGWPCKTYWKREVRERTRRLQAELSVPQPKAAQSRPIVPAWSVSLGPLGHSPAPPSSHGLRHALPELGCRARLAERLVNLRTAAGSGGQVSAGVLSARSGAAAAAPSCLHAGWPAHT